MNRRFALVATLAVACEAGPALARETLPVDQEFSRIMILYGERADITKHDQSYRGFKGLADGKPADYDLQIWCARTAFYYAHRRAQNDDNEGCARVARDGITCAERAGKARKGDYSARYWKLMNRMKAGATLGIIRALKAAKPLKNELEKLIASDPNRFEGYLFLGMLYRELPSVVSWGDDDKALEYVKKAERIAPRDPDVLLEVAEAFHKLGNDSMAEVYFRKVATSAVPEHLEWETWDCRRWARKRLKEIE